MRDDTLKAIAEELIRARKKNSQRGKHRALLLSHADALSQEMFAYNNPDGMHGSASQIYALAATVAAMAIRIMEEGSWDCRYAGNTKPPELTLEG